MKRSIERLLEYAVEKEEEAAAEYRQALRLAMQHEASLSGD